MRELAQEDIDDVYGTCDMQDAVWCLTHQSRVRPLAVRCDDWRDFEDSVMRVVERLKGRQAMDELARLTDEMGLYDRKER